MQLPDFVQNESINHVWYANQSLPLAICSTCLAQSCGLASLLLWYRAGISGSQTAKTSGSALRRRWLWGPGFHHGLRLATIGTQSDSSRIDAPIRGCSGHPATESHSLQRSLKVVTFHSCWILWPQKCHVHNVRLPQSTGKRKKIVTMRTPGGPR